jgi:predicted Zn-dependent peptidase
LILQKIDNELAGVYLIYKNPCFFENKSNFGVSHLLEHMICNSLDDKLSEYSRMAIENNAFTSKAYVCFYMTGLYEVVKTQAKDFFNRITSYKPIEKDFAKEMPIVCQEYEDYFSNTDNNFYLNLFAKKAGFIPPVGTREALSTIEFEDVDSFYKTYFKLSEVICVNKEHDNFGIIAPEMVSLETKDYERNFDLLEKTPINKASENMIWVNNKLLPEEEPYITGFISKMLSDGLESPLYKVVREEKGLVYGISSNNPYIRHYGQLFIVSVSVSSDKKQAVGDAIKEVIFNPDKHMTKDRYRDMYDNTVLRAKIREQNPISFSFIESKYLDYDNTGMYRNIDKIYYDNVMEYYKKYIMDESNFDLITHSEINGGYEG